MTQWQAPPGHSYRARRETAQSLNRRAFCLDSDAQECRSHAMQDAPDAEIQLRDIFEKYPTHVERYRAASRAFAIKPRSMQETVFRLWFDERHAEYEREQRK